MKAKQTQILVIGAGFAGMMATRRLAWKTRRSEAAITLVNGTEHFVERLSLHKFAANQSIRKPSLPSMLQGTNVNFVRGWVTAIHPNEHEVVVQSATGTQHLGYDVLVYALGSTMDRDSVPGVREHAYVLTESGERSAAALRKELPKLNETAGTVLIGGGGATGIEAAAEFADSYPNLHVHLVTRDKFGAFIREEVADYMEQSLRRRGVTIHDHTTIAEVRQNAAITETGETISLDLCLWTGGFTVQPLAREAGLAVNERGQTLIDPSMRSISHPDIYAVGDGAQPVEEPGAPFRMGAYTAVVTGRHAADCLSRTLRGQPAEPLSFAYAGQAIALGHRDAILFSIYPDDKARRPFLTGRVACRIRGWFINYLCWLLRSERRPGFLYVLGTGRYDAAKRRAEGQLTQVELSG